MSREKKEEEQVRVIIPTPAPIPFHPFSSQSTVDQLVYDYAIRKRRGEKEKVGGEGETEANVPMFLENGPSDIAWSWCSTFWKTLCYLGATLCLFLFAYHGYVTWIHLYSKELSTRRDAEHTMATTCQTPQGDRVIKMCLSTAEVLRDNLEYTVMHQWFNELLEHIPGVWYCKHREGCREWFVKVLDAFVYSWWWMLMLFIVFFIAFCMYSFPRWFVHLKTSTEKTKTFHRQSQTTLPSVYYNDNKKLS